MSDPKVEGLKWADIRSKTMKGRNYLDHIRDKTSVYANYTDYTPKIDVMRQIQELITVNNKRVNILAIGAEWCKDCALNVPRMLKIIEAVQSSNINLEVIYGVMVNALKKKGDLYWHKEKSPFEATDPRFGLTAIPTFYVFIDGEYFGRIVEGPENFDTLEEELLNSLKPIQNSVTFSRTSNSG